MSNTSLFRDCSEIDWWKSLEICKCYLKYTGIRELVVMIFRPHCTVLSGWERSTRALKY